MAVVLVNRYNRAMRWLVFFGAVNGFVAVSAGAFGAHALRERLSTRAMEIFELASRYQLIHALAILACAAIVVRTESLAANAAGWCFVCGTVIFSGSLYALALSGISKLGAITPIGGLLFLAGWALLAYSAITR